MKIVNPIYDVTFKYLFQDIEIARMLIELITGFEIKEIQNIGHEYYRPKPDQNEPDATIKATDIFDGSRLDFVCHIKSKEGKNRVCIIEIQRENSVNEVPRFRKYLGFHYSSEYNMQKNEPIEILSLYFLGKNDPELAAFPLVKVARKYVDLATGKEIEKIHSKFVEKLSHEVFVVNLKALETQQKTLPEKVLQIFNQKKMQTKTILEIDEHQYPESFSKILERLRLQNVQDNLILLVEAEAEKEARLENLLAERAKEKAEWEEMLRDKEYELETQRRAKVRAKTKAIEERQAKEKEREAKEKAIIKEAEERKAKEKYALQLVKIYMNSGRSIEEAADLVDLPIETVKKLLVE